MARVVLGFAADLPKSSQSACESLLGGKPRWLHPCTPPEPQLLRCSACGARMAFLSQVYAPRPEIFRGDRVLYLFSCLVGTCASTPLGWRILRAQVREPEQGSLQGSPPQRESQTNSDDKISAVQNWDFGAAEELEGTTQTSIAELEDLLEGLNTREPMEIPSRQDTQPKRPKGLHRQRPLPSPTITLDCETFPVCFALEAENESDSSPRPSSEQEHIESLYSVYKEQESGFVHQDGGGDAWSGETADDRLHADERAFRKYMKRLRRAPEQVLRYSFAGVPLWPQAQNISDKIAAMRCSRCNEPLVFEMQLMSTVLYYLDMEGFCAWKTASRIEATADWLTVCLAVCAASCWEAEEDHSVITETHVFIQNFPER
ncbi:Programmed cell death protein 2-like [Porphyridium purpureum]|uniref:Programmed cell death protein 2-like n=1 Tax=Porphyridium purpureum TaxID=35688 RepID=A0A5J4Z774_PORPP|nr:Programmed cell death protein 2-like [Porphyridium purpureum]|eukprot:POR8815..scf295_1